MIKNSRVPLSPFNHPRKKVVARRLSPTAPHPRLPVPGNRGGLKGKIRWRAPWICFALKARTHTRPGRGRTAAAALGWAGKKGKRARGARVVVPAWSRASRAPVHWRLLTRGGARQGGLALGGYAFGFSRSGVASRSPQPERRASPDWFVFRRGTATPIKVGFLHKKAAVDSFPVAEFYVYLTRYLMHQQSSITNLSSVAFLF